MFYEPNTLHALINIKNYRSFNITKYLTNEMRNNLKQNGITGIWTAYSREELDTDL